MNYGCEVLLGCDIGDNANPWDETDREGSHNTYSHPSDRRLGNPWHGLLGTGVLSLLNGPQQSAKVKGQNHCFGPMSRRSLNDDDPSATRPRPLPPSRTGVATRNRVRPARPGRVGWPGPRLRL